MPPIEDDVAGEFQHLDTTAQQALAEKVLAELRHMDDAQIEALCASLKLAVKDRQSAATAIAAAKQVVDIIRQFAPLAALVA
jgi:hypothetical protein